MRRREFIALVGGTTVSWPLSIHGEQVGKLPTVAILGTGTPGTQGQWNAAFVQRLGELGWIENRTVAINVRWADGRIERFSEIAAEFVRLRVDVIVTAGAPAVLATKKATAVIPIVAPIMGDPVGTSLVTSLARPGGNVTGLSIQAPGIESKRVELLRDVVPNVRRLAILTNAASPNSALMIPAVQAAARALGLETIAVQIRTNEDITPAIESLRGRADALYVQGDPLLTSNRIRINTLAVGEKLPTVYDHRQYVEAGGLMSYGPNVLDLFRRAGDLVDKVLRGANPADIPVEQPTKFELVVNLTTAKALGLTIPESLLLRADEVIE